MSSFRETIAPSKEDRAVAGHLSRAIREVESALGVARGFRKKGNYSRGAERDLRRALTALNEVGTLAPRYGSGDPDAITEEERNLAHRERLAQERAERKQKRMADISDE